MKIEENNKSAILNYKNELSKVKFKIERSPRSNSADSPKTKGDKDQIKLSQTFELNSSSKKALEKNSSVVSSSNRT